LQRDSRIPRPQASGGGEEFCHVTCLRRVRLERWVWLGAPALAIYLFLPAPQPRNGPIETLQYGSIAPLRLSRIADEPAIAAD
jgi:hypothetical protein